MITKLFPRIFKFWALHLAMAAVGALALAVNGPLQSVFSPDLAALVTFVASIAVTVSYFVVLMRASQKLLHSLAEGFLFGFTGALPMFLLILGAVAYLQRAPHHFIRYNFILLPVTLPFQGWIEYVFPAQPFHTLALAVPAVFIAALLTGSSLQRKN